MQTLILKGLRMEQCWPGYSHKETSQGKGQRSKDSEDKKGGLRDLATAFRSPSTDVARRETGKTRVAEPET